MLVMGAKFDEKEWKVKILVKCNFQFIFCYWRDIFRKTHNKCINLFYMWCYQKVKTHNKRNFYWRNGFRKTHNKCINLFMCK
jgi:hypothetical protein